jgi:hypothetical protein
MTQRSGGRRAGGAAIALAALSAAVAGCSQALPLGHAPASQQHLAAPIVLQVVVSEPSSATGTCPAGSARLPKSAEQFPGSGQCYRQIGKPLTITSAAVSYLQHPAANQQPANYGLGISLPAADKAAMLTITTRAYHSKGQIATIVAGRTWGVATVEIPFTSPFEIPAQNASQALQLQRTLIPSA